VFGFSDCYRRIVLDDFEVIRPVIPRRRIPTFRSRAPPEVLTIFRAKTTQDNGLDDEKPVHDVTISQAFYMGKYE
jgi:formylglycine-generating enzyme required for sulfatase activity